MPNDAQSLRAIMPRRDLADASTKTLKDRQKERMAKTTSATLPEIMDFYTRDEAFYEPRELGLDDARIYPRFAE